jgi:purine-binding chemotaxis protein CheW
MSQQTYILFSIAGTTYAVRSHDVLHVEIPENVTAVPNAAASVEGVVFSRGQVVPVINMRVRFGFQRVPIDGSTRLLVVQVRERRVALMVDAAREFMTIPEAAIQAPGEAITGLSGNYLDGVATMGDRIVLILRLADVVETAPHVAA